MRKYIIAYLTLFLFIFNNGVCLADTPKVKVSQPKVSAAAACLMDAGTGQVYYGKNADIRREPASLTKIMTAIIAIEKGNLSDVVTVSKRAGAVSMGQDLGLRAGDHLYLEELLKGALLYSANDTTVAIAEHVGGNHDNFVKMMNAKAWALGARNTQFANTNGFHNSNHYTTAYDLALITRYALKNPKFAEIVKTKNYEVTWLGKDKRKKNIQSTNRLLRENFPGIDGVKTGTTPMAGNCYIASATRNGRQLIAVVLHSGNRWNDAKNMLEYGFSEFSPITLVEKGERLAEIKVREGKEEKVSLAAAETLTLTLSKSDSANIKQQIKLASNPTAPVTQGQKLGQLIYRVGDKELARVNLIATKNIERKPWYQRLF